MARATTDWSIEQYYRDLAHRDDLRGHQPHPGLNLVGRKIPMGGGRLMMAFAKRAKAPVAETMASPDRALRKRAGRGARGLDEVTRP